MDESQMNELVYKARESSSVFARSHVMCAQSVVYLS